jgi:hypothetical protein
MSRVSTVKAWLQSHHTYNDRRPVKVFCLVQPFCDHNAFQWAIILVIEMDNTDDGL